MQTPSNHWTNQVYHADGTLYAATDTGLSISKTGGTSWVTKTMSNGMGSNVIRGVWASGSTIYAGSTQDGGSMPGGISISTDGGNTWIYRTTANGLGSNGVIGVYADAEGIYAGCSVGGASIAVVPVPVPVPEIDPAGMGSVLALLGGGLGLLERRRKRS